MTQCQNAIEHIAKSVLLSKYAVDSLMAMMTAYIDESGIHAGSPAVVIAGYISTVEKWECFQRAWSAELKNAGVGYLHMNEFCHSRGEFAGWSKESKDVLIKTLIQIVKDHVLFGVGCVLISKNASNVFNESQIKQLGDPTTFFAVLRALELSGEQPNGQGLSFVFDEKQDGVSLCMAAYKNAKQISNYGNTLNAISFADDKVITPLQAADLLAYEVHKLTADPERVSSVGLRASFRTLLGVRTKISIIVCANEDDPQLEGIMPMKQQVSEEYRRFENLMNKLAKVPYSELKAKLDAERRAKKRKPNKTSASRA